MNFKAAILQKRAKAFDIEYNVRTVSENLKKAADSNADILLLPECFLTGYVMPIKNEDALDDDSEYIRTIAEKAKLYGVGVVLTAFTKGKIKPQNTAYVIDKGGNILMKYSKVHTCDFADEACLESGGEFKVCSFHGVKLGIMICYDREYPESARILMLRGAEIILVPNDCCSMKPRVQALSTRAYENMVGIAMANPNGENAGCSCAFSPVCWDSDGKCIDNCLLMADNASEKLYYASFDMKHLRSYREREMMGNTFRKINAYGDLLSEKIEYPFIRK